MKEQLRAFEERPAEIVFHWHDSETEAKGWVVINSLRGGAAGGGARSACYPRGTFYPLSDSASTSHCRITSPDFRPCSTCQSHSQAPLCTYTRHLITNQAEGTFGRLRYFLGGNRPS